jgi:pimeloyl-ACP methyl ester carboxylesterase
MSTYLLVHGSWHAAWCWHKIVPRLERAGHKVMAVDLPGHGRDRTAAKDVSLASCAGRVCEAIDSADGPVILVGHSRGGMVISQAAEHRPGKIRTLVYLAAFLIPGGERVLEYGQRDTQSLIRANLDVNREEAWDMLRESAYREALYADCAEDDIALARLLLAPEPIAPTLTPLALSEAAFGRVPRVYLELLQDRAVSLPLQRAMQAAMPCGKVLSIDASHSAYFSRPDELAAHLLALAA